MTGRRTFSVGLQIGWERCAKQQVPPALGAVVPDLQFSCVSSGVGSPRICHDQSINLSQFNFILNRDDDDIPLVLYRESDGSLQIAGPLPPAVKEATQVQPT